MVSYNFRSYQLALELHQRCKELRCPFYLRDQLMRASSLICLNLAEGSGKPSAADQRRFFWIALGSLREVQAILDLTDPTPTELIQIADQVGAHVYRLCQSKPVSN